MSCAYVFEREINSYLEDFFSIYPFEFTVPDALAPGLAPKWAATAARHCVYHTLRIRA